MKISEEKREKISEQILAYLYEISPKSVFISDIAREIARDEEFVKKLLKNLKSQRLVADIRKNSQGIPYVRRSRWRLSEGAYKLYTEKQ